MEFIDKDILQAILETEGCLIDPPIVIDEFPDFETIRVISPCKRHHTYIDVSDEDIPKAHILRCLEKLSLNELSDRLPFRNLNLAGFNNSSEG